MTVTAEKKPGRPSGRPATAAAAGDGFAAQLGRRVRALRSDAGLSLADAAERSRGIVSYGAWRRLELGESVPNTLTFYGVSLALGVTTDELLTPDVRAAARQEGVTA
jgi:transcriptional regulator with XRE-family HTH domain